MRTNVQLSALLRHYDHERDMARAEELEARLIPHQAKLAQEAERLGLPYVADLRILEGMKREYKCLTGKEYQ